MIDNIQNEITLQSLSTDASERQTESYLPNNAQPSVEEVPTTNTSPRNKGKSRQVYSPSEESFLKNGPHSKKSLDTVKSSEPTTSDSYSRLLNELPFSSLPPLHSEAASNDAISMNSERDITEDDSDSDSNSMTPEEVGFVYDLWRQIPEEPSPWESTASLLDKLKHRGVISRQKLQH